MWGWRSRVHSEVGTGGPDLRVEGFVRVVCGRVGVVPSSVFGGKVSIVLLVLTMCMYARREVFTGMGCREPGRAL